MSSITVNWINRSWDYICNGPKQDNAPTKKEHQDFINDRKTSFPKTATPAQTFSLGGAILFGIGWLFSLRSDNSFAKWATGILTGVGAIATAITGLTFGWKVKASNNTKIDHNSAETKNDFTSVSVDLIRFPDDPKPSSDKQFVEAKEGGYFVGLKGNNATLGETLEVPVRTRERLNHYNNQFPDWNKIKSLRIEDIPHKVYKAATGASESKVDILIPEIYEEARPEATKEILDAIEIALNELPASLLKLGLFKVIKLNIGENYNEPAHRTFEKQHGGSPHRVKGIAVMSANSEELCINIYQETFTGKSSTLDDRENIIVKALKGIPKAKLEANNSFISKNVFQHEIGHLLANYLRRNPSKFDIPILKDNGLEINDEFAELSWDSEKDAWAKIVKMDSNKTSNKGQVGPHEDFAESVAGYLIDPVKFKELFPNRWKFLNIVIST